MKNMNIEDNYALVIPAGGKGSRFGTDIPKQFFKIDEKEIILHTLEKFIQSHPPNEIVIACHIDWIIFMDVIINQIGFSPIKIIEGGSSRASSVYKAIQKIEKSKKVLIHDAVRPFVSNRIIESVISELDFNKGVIPAISVSDTIKIAHNNYISSTPERSDLFAAQTPQGFDLETLIKANRFILQKNFTPTDDASILEAYGEKVKIVEGSSENIKITTQFDLKLAELIMK